MPELDPAPSSFWQAVRANHRLQRQTPTIQPHPPDVSLPLTFGQERLWRIDHLQAGTTAHNLRAVFRLQGQLNLAALHQSLQTIVQRHAILRTRFPAEADEPVQVVEPDYVLALPVVDLTTVPPNRQAAEVQRLSVAEAQHPFDLAQGPLLRLKLLRLSDDTTLLVRTIHHIINDRWSDSVFVRELAALYTAFAQGKPSPLPVLPIQYADFAFFQRQWLQGEVLASQLDYWREQLAGHLQPLDLPGAQAPSIRPDYHGDVRYLTIPPEVTASLKQLASQFEVSFFVVLLAAFKALLAHYSRQDELCVCVPVAGRTQPQTRTLIGYFANLVLIRTSLQDIATFADLIRQVSRVTVDAFEHQLLPLQHIADELHIPGAILSRALFTLQNVPALPTEMAGVKIVPEDIPEGISNFDLSLSLKMRDEHLVGVLRYKTALFQPETMARLLENFQLVLQAVGANPEQRLSDMPGFVEHASPEDVSQSAAVVRAYVAPETDLERTVAAVWQTVLRLEQISVEADFFELGGRSLDLVHVRDKLQQAVQQEIPLQDLFQQSTIRLLAHYLDQKQDVSQSLTSSAHQRAQDQRRALQRRKEQMQRRRKHHG